MTLYVPDVKTKRWVIISENRSGRPDDIKRNVPALSERSESKCPFCSGNEHMTPPELYRIGTGGKEERGWQVRVVPNKFPITDTHEVFIHSPSHDQDVSLLPLSQVEQIFHAYRDRYLAHATDGHVIIFCNHGHMAGASLAHPHSQLVVVAHQITFDALSREPVRNVVESLDGFVSYCPDFSQWPYEVWISSEHDTTTFGDTTNMELSIVAKLLQKTIRRLRTIHTQKQLSKSESEKQEFSYNYYISHTNNWFIRVIPRFIHRAGFELGSGLSVNTISPQFASQELIHA